MLKFLKKIFNGAAEEIGEAEEKLHFPLWPTGHYSTYVDEFKVARGSWPRKDELEAMKRQGFTTVVNLCAERNQDKAVIAAGLTPINIPVRDNTVPSPAQVAQFLAICVGRDDKTQLYVHCEQGAGRTGCMAAAYEVIGMGQTVDYSLYWAKHFGMRVPCQLEFVKSLKRGN